MGGQARLAGWTPQSVSGEQPDLVVGRGPGRDVRIDNAAQVARGLVLHADADGSAVVRTGAEDGLGEGAPRGSGTIALRPVIRPASPGHPPGATSMTGQVTPVPWSGQYPPGTFARYCWWYSSA